jgi:hypothetical protein
MDKCIGKRPPNSTRTELQENAILVYFQRLRLELKIVQGVLRSSNFEAG